MCCICTDAREGPRPGWRLPVEPAMPPRTLGSLPRPPPPSNVNALPATPSGGPPPEKHTKSRNEPNLAGRMREWFVASIEGGSHIRCAMFAPAVAPAARSAPDRVPGGSVPATTGPPSMLRSLPTHRPWPRRECLLTSQAATCYRAAIREVGRGSLALRRRRTIGSRACHPERPAHVLLRAGGRANTRPLRLWCHAAPSPRPRPTPGVADRRRPTAALHSLRP